MQDGLICKAVREVNLRSTLLTRCDPLRHKFRTTRVGLLMLFWILNRNYQCTSCQYKKKVILPTNRNNRQVHMQWWIYKIFLIDTKKWSITFSKKKDNINFIKKVLEELETVKIRMINAHAM